MTEPMPNDVFMTVCQRGRVLVHKCTHGKIGWVSVAVLDDPGHPETGALPGSTNLHLTSAEAVQLAEMIQRGPESYPDARPLGPTCSQFAVMVGTVSASSIGEMSISAEKGMPDRICLGLRKGEPGAWGSGALAVLDMKDRAVVVNALQVVALGRVAAA